MQIVGKGIDEKRLPLMRPLSSFQGRFDPASLGNDGTCSDFAIER
ncbi:hypothetical protein I543_0082 [Mycobacteroides abscessus 21]|uniref:Uncharacterized protein n=1 Tax=Mycobacteroides abscessus 21 TaxID=1299324 RepID=A0A829PZP2_9MYCO|nr:hypothetical protein I543_0082 [Mycobacteroides abscessus 21]